MYLTKNRYGSMVVMSLEKYSKLMNEVGSEIALDEKFGSVDIEKMLDISEKELNAPNTKYITHEEVFSKAKRLINGKK